MTNENQTQNLTSPSENSQNQDPLVSTSFPAGSIPELIDDITSTKPFYKSKTFWVVVGIILTAIINAYGTFIPEWLYAILGALGLISLRVGDKTLTKN